MKWILDDMAFGHIARLITISDISVWPAGILFLANTTVQAACLDHSGRRSAVLAARSVTTGEAVFSSFTVTVGSPAGIILYDHLRTGSGGSANLAEHESIAWALTDPDGDSVFVTQDKLAAMLALAELGRTKVCHSYELWNEMLSNNYLTQQQFRDLMTASANRDKSIPAVPRRLRCSY